MPGTPLCVSAPHLAASACPSELLSLSASVLLDTQPAGIQGLVSAQPCPEQAGPAGWLASLTIASGQGSPGVTSYLGTDQAGG